jgi:hypothetical protein
VTVRLIAREREVIWIECSDCGERLLPSDLQVGCADGRMADSNPLPNAADEVAHQQGAARPASLPAG